MPEISFGHLFYYAYGVVPVVLPVPLDPLVVPVPVVPLLVLSVPLPVVVPVPLVPLVPPVPPVVPVVVPAVPLLFPPEVPEVLGAGGVVTVLAGLLVVELLLVVVPELV